MIPEATLPGSFQIDQIRLHCIRNGLQPLVDFRRPRHVFGQQVRLDRVHERLPINFIHLDALVSEPGDQILLGLDDLIRSPQS